MAKEEEDVTCPVCGGLVNLEVTSCPHCGAEFEEEEVEEVIEVEEKVVPAEEVEEEPAAEEEYVEEAAEEVEEEEVVAVPPPSSIADFRVLGLALAVLGIIGAQIALFIDWYWKWVPPIEDNLGMFVAIPVVVVAVGFLVFLLVKKAMSAGRKVPGMMPGTSLAVFLFGILALIVMFAYKPINNALQDSKAVVAGMFLILLVVGIGLVLMGSKSAARAAT